MVDLYALAPEEFTAARDAAAKVDGALKALRRPTVSAWVVNTLVRRDPGLLDQLLALGAELAEAQRAGQGAALRELGERRRQLVQAVTTRAVGLVEREVGTAVRAEVESTLEAALADPASGEAVRSGQLVRPLAFAGFGGVDLDGAVAPLPLRSRKAARKAPAEATALAVAEAAATALEAGGALDDAVRRAEAAARAADEHDREVAAAHADEQAAAARVVQARAELQAAEQGQAEARRRRTKVEKEGEGVLRRTKAARSAVAAAQDAADAARKGLDRRRRG